MQKEEPLQGGGEITSDIGFMYIIICISIKLNQKNKWFAKMSSLAQAITKKNIKNSYFGR